MDHSAYKADASGCFRTYCPACLRDVRCGPLAPDGVVTFYRHWLDPHVPKGERDRCANSRVPVAEAWFCLDNGRLIPRAAWEVDL